MHRFEIDSEFEADCVSHEQSRIGEVYHVRRNDDGGAMLTPVARYFAWRPEYTEGFNDHWRIDCFVQKHRLAPKPEKLGKALTKGLTDTCLCDEPIWIAWHTSKEIEGEALGDVFDLD